MITIKLFKELRKFAFTVHFPPLSISYGYCTLSESPYQVPTVHIQMQLMWHTTGSWSY